MGFVVCFLARARAVEHTLAFRTGLCGLPVALGACFVGGGLGGGGRHVCSGGWLVWLVGLAEERRCCGRGVKWEFRAERSALLGTKIYGREKGGLQRLSITVDERRSEALKHLQGTRNKHERERVKEACMPLSVTTHQI